MHGPRHDAQEPGATTQADDGKSASELNILRDVLRMLPNGVTVQDESGRVLLANDAAATQLRIGADGADPHEQRLEAVRETFRTGEPVVVEESFAREGGRQVFLTSHHPVRIAERNLLLSSSADISEQKAFEDQLFRSAYYDELTELPSRRVIEHRANNLLRGDGAEKFALAFLDIDNFKQINDYYGHSIGDALLIELARRICRELRDSDMLSRISGDEFLLLLSPVQSQVEVAEFLKSLIERLTAPFFIDGSEIFA